MTAFGLVLFLLVSAMSAIDLLYWMGLVMVLIILFVIYVISFIAVLRSVEVILITNAKFLPIYTNQNYVLNNKNSKFSLPYWFPSKFNKLLTNQHIVEV